MAKGFKNALCLAKRPIAVYEYSHLCKRRKAHDGPHRVVYRDAIVEWGGGIRDQYNDADRTVRLTAKPGYRIEGGRAVAGCSQGKQRGLDA